MGDNDWKSKRFCSNVTCDQVSFIPFRFEKKTSDRKLALGMRRMYVAAFVWTSTKNEWNVHNAIDLFTDTAAILN